MNVQHIVGLFKLWRNQWKSRDELEHIRLVKLQRLVRHAYTQVPYYHQLFLSAGIRPDDIRSLDDLKHVPITTRKTVNELSREQFLARNINIRDCKKESTSGTMGFPLAVFKTRADSSLMSLSWARAFMASGMKPWQRMLAFIGQKEVQNFRKWHEFLRIWPRKEISTWLSPAQWAEEIQKYKPDVFISYVMTLKILAEYSEENRVSDIKPRLIFHSSALLDSFSRHEFERIFGAKIIDFYGSDEAGCISWECPICDGYHQCIDMVITEIEHESQPGGPEDNGEIIVTNLHSYAMPFIRYQQGDVGSFLAKKPSCGRTFPLMAAPVGRCDDFIVLRSGQKMSPHPFYHCIDPVPGIRRWNIIQKEDYEIVVSLEARTGFSEESRLNIEERISLLVNKQCPVTVTVVESLPIKPGTKFRAVKSLLSGPANPAHNMKETG